jgi:hypothetical protein
MRRNLVRGSSILIWICFWLLTGCANEHSPAPPGAIRITSNPQYDEKIAKRILKNWLELSNNSDVNFNSGKVIVSFVLHSDGTVTDTDITMNNVGYLPGLTCVEAVLKSTPFPKWSSEMVKKLGDHCDVEFTFNYHGQ